MKLFICGNGFDLHHGLKTSYLDYCRFLKKRDSSLLREITLEDSFTGLGSNLVNPYDAFWTDVESNYSFDLVSMFADNKGENYPSDMEDGDSKWNDMEIDAEEKYLKFSKFTSSYLKEWILSTNYDDVLINEDLRLSLSDCYVTFNYTRTLEDKYSIPYENILHIHGDVSNPQFGNPFVSPKEIEKELSEKNEQDDYYSASVKPAISNYVKLAKAISKDLQSNSPNLERFLKDKKLAEIVILGHSYNGVDKFYYDSVFVRKFSNISWTIYCRTLRDKNNADEFFSKNDINGCVKKW